MAEVDRGNDGTSDDTYNGWENYPTWVAVSWLSNNEPNYRMAQDIVGEANNALQGGEGLRAWVQENNPLAHEATLYSDILGWAIQAIDWSAVARVFEDEGEGIT